MIYNGDCMQWLRNFEHHIDMIFADPPDNIGLGYNAYEDVLEKDEYVQQMHDWVHLFCRRADTVWLSFNSRWIIDVASIAASLDPSAWAVKPCVQTFSFYQHNKHDMGNAHRPLWRFSKLPVRVYPEQAKIESWRMAHGDKRAKAGGKVPSDVFDFPRVTGNSKQRRPYHPTQLHEGLVERCVLLSTKPGDLVVDPFAGTGTTLRVCKRIDRECQLCDIDAMYCGEIAKEHGQEVSKI